MIVSLFPVNAIWVNSYQEFVERLITQLPGLFRSVEELRQIWSDPDERETVTVHPDQLTGKK